jgi:hypothetical protein
MTRVAKLLSLCLFASVFASITLHAESKNPADYPLRIHILGKNQTTFYHNRFPDEAKGEGRANIFENSEARGVDFTFDCSEKLKASFGFESYPARWKKPNQELIVLLPVFGKTGSYFTCNLKTDVKDFAYAMHNGKMISEPVADYKKWMIKHDYDPEHGKNTPTRVEAGEDPTAQPAPPQ